MRKICLRLTVFLLALLILCGCGSSASFGRLDSSGQPSSVADISRIDSLDGVSEIAVPHYGDIEYLRPDPETLRGMTMAVKAAVSRGDKLRDVTGLLDDCYREYYSFYTMYNLADIRSCTDTSDTYYANELSWCESNYLDYRNIMEELLYFCGNSDMADELEDAYFWDGFCEEYSGSMDSAVFGDRFSELSRQESELMSRYRSLISAPTVEMDGETVYYNEYVLTADEEQYEEALEKYYRKYNPQLAEIYIELVRVRREMALELGYDSFEQMQYEYYFERDYTPEDAAGYVEDIKSLLVPLYKKVMAEDPYSRVDYSYLSSERLLDIVGAAADEIGGGVEEAFDFMTRYGYYDCSVSHLKAAMSFQTYLSDYEAPFLFIDAYGDMEDVLLFSHEFGHYADAYVNYDAYETTDTSECFSHALEYLVLDRCGSVLSGEERSNLYLMKMLDTMELYIQQASYAEFEHLVYSADPNELSEEFLSDLALELALEYGYGSSEDAFYYAQSWTDIVHFFELPFYVISYPVSNDIAMQIYELERLEKGLGVKKYLDMLSRDSAYFMEVVQDGGLESPFSDGRIEKVRMDLEQMLSA